MTDPLRGRLMLRELVSRGDRLRSQLEALRAEFDLAPDDWARLRVLQAEQELYLRLRANSRATSKTILAEGGGVDG